MTTYKTQIFLPYDPKFVYDWHLRTGAFQRLAPPWENIEFIDVGTGISEGSEASFYIERPPFKFRWVAKHITFSPGKSFTDVMVKGPLSSWSHKHSFEKVDDGTLLIDDINYHMPVLEGYFTANLKRQIIWRHQRLKQDLALHHKYADKPRLKVGITGASGLIGQALTSFLTTGGHQVYSLPRPSLKVVPDQYEGLDVVVNLAGEPISKRWTPKIKQSIMDSREQGTYALSKALGDLANPPRVLISASASGWYGASDEEFLDEDALPGKGYISEVCKRWEAAADPARKAGIRVVHPRIGVVLSGNGGALTQLLTPIKFGVGGPLGDGKQWMSWISLDDLIYSFYRCMYESDWEGPYNAVSPNPVTNKNLVKTIGNLLNRPTVFSIPAFMIRLIFGEFGQSLLLDGAKLRPKKLQDWGFEYTHSICEKSLRNELGIFEK